MLNGKDIIKKRWNAKYDCCINCKTTQHHHNGFGLCWKCNLARKKITLSKDIDTPPFGYRNIKVKNKKEYMKELILKDITINSDKELKKYTDILNIYKTDFTIYQLNKAYGKRMKKIYPYHTDENKALTEQIKIAYNILKEYLESKIICKELRTQSLDELKAEMKRNGRGYVGKGNGTGNRLSPIVTDDAHEHE